MKTLCDKCGLKNGRVYRFSIGFRSKTTPFYLCKDCISKLRWRRK